MKRKFKKKKSWDQAGMFQMSEGNQQGESGRAAGRKAFQLVKRRGGENLRGGRKETH